MGNLLVRVPTEVSLLLSNWLERPAQICLDSRTGEALGEAADDEHAIEAIDDVSGSIKGISKNAKKRLAREERAREKKRLRKEERQADSAARKEQRRKERNALLASLPENEREIHLEARKASFRKGRLQERTQRAELRDTLRHKTHYAVCIDLGWTAHMTEKELKSLVRQVAYSYNILRKTVQMGNTPVKLSVAGIDERMKEILTHQSSGWQDWPIAMSEDPLTKLHQSKNIVYLTHDATDVLQALEADKVYVIGGIVDRNRLKGATLEKARRLGLSTARLNLNTSVHMDHGTPVLTVNHCVEILQLAATGLSWQDAYIRVLPPRKGLTSVSDPNAITEELRLNTNVQPREPSILAAF